MIALLWAAIAVAVPVERVPNPREHDGWVTDMASVMDEARIDRVEALIDRVHDDVGVECCW